MTNTSVPHQRYYFAERSDHSSQVVWAIWDRDKPKDRAIALVGSKKTASYVTDALNHHSELWLQRKDAIDV
jgi:hypothetical protein